MKYTIKYQKDELTIVAEAENEEERKQVVNGIKFIIEDIKKGTKQPKPGTKQLEDENYNNYCETFENEPVFNANERIINGYLYHKCYAKSDGHEFWALVNPEDAKKGAQRFYNWNQIK